MPKGNIPINKNMAKIIENGRITQEIPLILCGGRMQHLFTPINPTDCILCGSSLKPNEKYDRFIISSYGIIKCPVVYWICTNPDVGEIYTEGLTDVSGRAPCPTTLWKYEQKGGTIAAQELAKQEINFDGTVYIDGYFVKVGWRKFIEAQIGRKFTDTEWKMMRYKVIYVVATKDKVVLDFEITNNKPSHIELIPLLKRIKDRIPEAQLIKIVSDEDDAIIGAVRVVFPKVSHAFCVYHQMKNVTKKYADEFKYKEDIPVQDLEVYETANELITAENVKKRKRGNQNR